MQTVLKAVALVVLTGLLLGCGLCGAAGTVIGVVSLFGHGEEMAGITLLPGIVGLVVAFGAWKGIAALVRSKKTPLP